MEYIFLFFLMNILKILKITPHVLSCAIIAKGISLVHAQPTLLRLIFAFLQGGFSGKFLQGFKNTAKNIDFMQFH